MICIICRDAEALKGGNGAICLECGMESDRKERESFRKFREDWIEELTIKHSLCIDGGWYPWTPQSCREWFLAMWPNFTPKKEYEQKIDELRKELGLPSLYPRHYNLCPCTPEQGRKVNAKFEELAAQ